MHFFYVIVHIFVTWDQQTTQRLNPGVNPWLPRMWKHDLETKYAVFGLFDDCSPYSKTKLPHQRTRASHRITDRSFRYMSHLVSGINFPVLFANLIPVSITCLFMLPPHLLTVSTHHSHHP